MLLTGMYETNGQLNAWWHRRLGEYVLEAQMHLMDELVTELRGDHAVLLGCSEQMRIMRHSKIPYQCVLNRTVSSFSAHRGIRGLWENLPLADNSVKTMIVPHTLEMLSHDVPTLFNEIYRVLKSDGDLIVFGFNPSLMWRFWRVLYPKDCTIPWFERCRKRSDLRFSLSLLDYRVVHQETFVHQFPQEKRNCVRALNFIFNIVKKVCPWFGGVYLLHVKKEKAGMTPVALSWKEKYAGIEAIKKVAPLPRAKVELE